MWIRPRWDHVYRAETTLPYSPAGDIGQLADV